MRLRQIPGHIGQAESGQRRIEHLGSAVEDELATNSHFQLAVTFFELSGVQPAISWQAQIDAVMVSQVLWLLWWRSLREIGWGADDRHTHVRSNTDCDHVLLH